MAWGGHVGGARASEMAVSVFASHFAKTAGNADQRMRESLDAANAAISDAVAQDPEYAGMGCTLLACQITGKMLCWLSVGDSPLWLLRENEMSRLNEDHSMRPVLQDLVELGRISAEDMEVNAHINQLRSAVTGGDVPMVDQNSRALLAGDCIILGSDGLETLTMDEIGGVCQAHHNPAAAAEALLGEVNMRQLDWQDNATVVIYNNPGGDLQTALFNDHMAPDQTEPSKTTLDKLFPWRGARG